MLELRQELAELLRKSGCVVVPETNPLDADEVYERAPEWIANCSKFVQLLGRCLGKWRHDDAGFVIYQHKLARGNNKLIFVYRGPSLDVAQIKQPKYREFLEYLGQNDTGSLENFAQSVVQFVESTFKGVYMMASERDQNLEHKIRQLLKELKVDVYPLPRAGQNGRAVMNVLNEDSSFLEVVRRRGAILLINGNIKEDELWWIDNRVADINFYVQRKLRGRLPARARYAIVDAPPDPRLEPCDVCACFPANRQPSSTICKGGSGRLPPPWAILEA